MINSKSTKAEILAAYIDLKEKPVKIDDVAAWSVSTLQTIVKEARELVTDCYKLGRATRRWYDQVKAELNRPLFKV